MKNYILIINLFLSAYAFSQNYVDLLKVNAATSSLNKFDTSSSKTRINELMADLTIPVKINDKLSFLTGFIYETVQAKLFSDGNIKSFGSTTVKLGANKLFNDTWSGTLVLLPKIASDYVSIGQKDFQVGAIGIMRYKKRDNLNYKIGLYYNSELFGPFFVPMLGLYYLSPNKKFETTLMLPLQADANYKVLNFMTVGCNFNGQTRSYHLTDITPEYHSTYIARVTNEFFAYLKFNISKSFIIQTKLGQSVARSYRVYDESDRVTFSLPATYIGAKRHPLNSDFSNGLIFQVVLYYRFSLEK